VTGRCGNAGGGGVFWLRVDIRPIAVNDAHVWILKEIEETRGKIEATIRTMHALIDNLGICGLALVRDCDVLITVRAVVPLLDIHRDNIITVGVCCTASAKSSVVEGKLLVASVSVTAPGVVVEGDNVRGKDGGNYK